MSKYKQAPRRKRKKRLTKKLARRANVKHCKDAIPAVLDAFAASALTVVKALRRWLDDRE